MRLLITFCLCFYLLIVSANQDLTDGNCHDHGIFSAVDAALKTYNAEKKDGNQFVLYRITDAKIKHENDIITHKFVTYGIREGSCGVSSGKVWQECDFNSLDYALGKCSAHVLFNKDLVSNEVISQNCSAPIVEPPVDVIKQPILGQYQSIDTNSKELLAIVKSVIEKVNSDGNHPYLFDLDYIRTAERQVVAGWNYKTEYHIKQTNCSKSEFTTVTSKECQIDKDAKPGNCSARVFVLPNETIRDIYVECISHTGYCLSCPNDIEPSDPFLQNLLKEAIDQYNSNSNSTNLFKILKVIDAKKDTAGLLYNIKFSVQETSCSKTEYRFLEERCQPFPSSTQLTCHASANIADKNIQTKSECTKETQARILKGLSPLRTLVFQFGVLHRTKRTPNKPKEHHKGDHGKKEKKEKKDKKKKHDHDKDDSSEESKENERGKSEVTVNIFVPGKVIPDRTTQQTSVLHTTHDSLKIDTTIKSLLPDAPTPDTSTQQNNVFTTQSTTGSDNHFPQIIPPLPDTNDSPLLSLLPPLPDVEDNFFNIHDELLGDLPEAKCPGEEWKPVRSLPTSNPLTSPKSTSSAVQSTKSDPEHSFTDEDLLGGLDF